MQNKFNSFQIKVMTHIKNREMLILQPFTVFLLNNRYATFYTNLIKQYLCLLSVFSILKKIVYIPYYCKSVSVYDKPK